MNTKTVSIELPIPYARNPRKNDAAVDVVAASLKEFGWQQPLVLDKEDVIVVGHTRLLAAKKLGMTEVPVVWAEELSLEQVKAYRIADNKTSDYSEFDNSLLVLELQELKKADYDLLNTGFTDEDSTNLLKYFEKEQARKDRDANADSVPEPPETPKTQLGDLYQLGEHRVLCGDSTDNDSILLLLEGAHINMVITDPPYGIGYEYNEYEDTKGDEYLAFCDKWFGVIDSVEAEFVAITTGWKYYPYWWSKEPRDIMFWLARNKQSGGTAFHYRKVEPIFIWGKPHTKYDADFFEQVTERNNLGDLHTCPKPVELIGSLIKRGCKLGGTVLDIFLGSGTTLISAEKLNRICYGIELDPRYVDVIIDRWEDYTGDKAVKIT